MKINREKFLDMLNMLKPGLSSREFLEQSSCIVFQNGWAMTFNDEVACRMKSGIASLEGAVQAGALMDILQKMGDPELLIRQNPKGELEFKGKRKGFGITMDAEVTLPIDRVEMPEKWRDLPPEFIEAIGLTHNCCSTDESLFHLNCIHLHPDYIEATDNLQVMRCRFSIGLKKSILVRGKSIAHICQLAMDKIALTPNWVHFKNQAGLILSCRRYMEEFENLDRILEFEGHDLTIPKGISEATKRAAVFSSSGTGEALVTVTLSKDRVLIKSQSAIGWYSEPKKIVYDGPKITFMIAPDLLADICKKYSEAKINESRLSVNGGNWQYVTALGAPEEVSAEEDNQEEPEEE